MTSRCNFFLYCMRLLRRFFPLKDHCPIFIGFDSCSQKKFQARLEDENKHIIKRGFGFSRRVDNRTLLMNP